jgi:eukaryotic-like serine/threonine-protein kinase
LEARRAGKTRVVARVAEILAGRYELLEVIGRGGMGVVYRARDRTLERTVAVKVLPAEFAEDVTLVERFSREARAAARLSDPHIVAVFDSGRDDDMRYIVMECVPGVSLARLLQERGPLAPPESVEIAAQIATALAAAHAAGIVHRDVKPANVMVQPSQSIKVLDFGIAHAAADHALTRTTMVLGSAPYLAPEVALGGSADERSDIYALGCVLYEMLTGRPPFVGDLPAAVMNQHATVAPQPVRAYEPTVPGALDELIMQMLAKDPSERPQAALELASRVRGSLHAPTAATAIASPVPPPPVARPPVPPQPVAPPTMVQDAGSPGWSRRPVLALVALVFVLGIGVAVALAASSGSGRHGASSTALGHSAPTTRGPRTTHSSSQTGSSTASVTPSTSSTPSTSGAGSGTSTTPTTSSTTTSTPTSTTSTDTSAAGTATTP